MDTIDWEEQNLQRDSNNNSALLCSVHGNLLHASSKSSWWHQLKIVVIVERYKGE
jgi:hypothetical protein